MKDDGTEAEDARRHGSSASLSDGPRITRQAHRHKSAVERGITDGHTEDSDQKLNEVPLDFEEVRSRLHAGRYSIIVCTTRLMLDLLAR